MTDERTKILEMIRDGIITIEEGEELLRLLDETDKTDVKRDSKFKKKIKEDLQKTKADLLKAKERLVEEYEKINLDKIKSKIKKGIEKIDKAVGKVDETILNYANKMMNKNMVDEEVEEKTVDLTTDKNITFIDKNK